MSKISRIERKSNEEAEFTFFCPGCKCGHWFKTDKPEPTWKWNGDFDKPTITPSLRVRLGNSRLCHSFVTDGKIRFLNDCTHDMKGQTVELPDWDDME